jgi:predicted nucleotidyltransferase
MLVYNLNVIEKSLLMHKVCLFVNRLADVTKDVQVSGTLENWKNF